MAADLDSDAEKYLRIPHTEISPSALRGLIEAFVLREGTDYGEIEARFDDKVAEVLAQLERGEARIVFDSRTRSVGIVPAG